MSDPLFPIALAACDLKAAAPKSFDDLIKAMKAWEERTIDDLLAAGPSDIVGAQSIARTARQIRTKLETCMQTRDTAERRK